MGANVGCVSRLCSFRKCPPATEPELLDFFLNEGRRIQSPAVMIFAKDEFTIFASRNRRQLRDYYRFVLPEEHVSEAMVDKHAQYKLAEKLGIPYPRISLVRTMDELIQVRDALEYPVLIKPVHSHLWRKHFTDKVLKAYDAEEMTKHYEKAVAHQFEVLLQLFVPGPVSNIRVLGSHVVQKIRQYPPVFGEASMAVTVRDPRVHELGLNFALGAGYRGPCNTEFKYDESIRSWKLMELNARFWNYTSLGTSAGSDLPLLNYFDADRQKPAPREGYKTGVYWLHTGKDIQWFHECDSSEKLSMSNWLLSWTKG